MAFLARIGGIASTKLRADHGNNMSTKGQHYRFHAAKTTAASASTGASAPSIAAMAEQQGHHIHYFKKKSSRRKRSVSFRHGLSQSDLDR
eukprot:4612399-Amphidinium_carterae.1